MINVVLKGVDEFLGAHVETILSPSIAKLYEVSNDEVIFTCYHSIIYHGGMDQTSYHMMITIEANKKFKNKEKIKSTKVKVQLIYPLGSFALNLKPV